MISETKFASISPKKIPFVSVMDLNSCEPENSLDMDCFDDWKIAVGKALGADMDKSYTPEQVEEILAEHYGQLLIETKQGLVIYLEVDSFGHFQPVMGGEDILETNFKSKITILFGNNSEPGSMSMVSYTFQATPQGYRIPDFAYIPAERVRLLTREYQIHSARNPICPTLIVEADSFKKPSDFKKYKDRLEEYFSNQSPAGVRLVLLVDPSARVAYSYSHTRSRWCKKENYESIDISEVGHPTIRVLNLNNI